MRVSITFKLRIALHTAGKKKRQKPYQTRDLICRERVKFFRGALSSSNRPAVILTNRARPMHMQAWRARCSTDLPESRSIDLRWLLYISQGGRGRGSSGYWITDSRIRGPNRARVGAFFLRASAHRLLYLFLIYSPRAAATFLCSCLGSERAFRHFFCELQWRLRRRVCDAAFA